MRKIILGLLLGLFAITGTAQNEQLFASSDPGSSSKKRVWVYKPVFTETELDRMIEHLNEDRQRELHLKFLIRNKGEVKVKRFLMSGDVTPKEVQAKCVFFFQEKKGRSLKLLSKEEFREFKMVLYNQAGLISDETLKKRVIKALS